MFHQWMCNFPHPPTYYIPRVFLFIYCISGSSSPSSSDDEIKEAFHTNSSQHSSDSPHTHHAWGVGGQFPSSTSFVPSSSTKQPLSGWNIEAVGRPLKVVPGRHKHKFFAQMSSNFSDRPYLDFNKMQHSKRLVMVRQRYEK